MRVMVIVKADQKSESEKSPAAGDEKLFAEMTRFNEELVKAGVMLGGEGLKPSSQGARVRFAGKGRTVIDGPFAETKELVAGFWLWQVKSMADAIEWLERAPFDGCDVEIRPLWETADFADADPSGELREREERLREQVAARQ